MKQRSWVPLLNFRKWKCGPGLEELEKTACRARLSHGRDRPSNLREAERSERGGACIRGWSIHREGYGSGTVPRLSVQTRRRLWGPLAGRRRTLDTPCPGPAERRRVQWQVAIDERFRNLVREGDTFARGACPLGPRRGRGTVASEGILLRSKLENARRRVRRYLHHLRRRRSGHNPRQRGRG